MEDYDKAIELDPSSAMAYRGRGIAYVVLGQDEKADADGAKACFLLKAYC